MRASTLFCANIARIRISTIAPNHSEKPSSVGASGQSSEPSMLDPRRVMLGPWCRLFHQTTDRLMMGMLTAPTSAKIAVTLLTPACPSRALALASAI